MRVDGIHTTGGPTAKILCSADDAKFNETIALANLSAPLQEAWTDALSYASSSVLQEAESILWMMITPHDNAIVTDTDGGGEAIAWRDSARIDFNINTSIEGRPAVRAQALSIEQIPSDIRDGLLSIYTALKSLDRAGLVELAPQ